MSDFTGMTKNPVPKKIREDLFKNLILLYLNLSFNYLLTRHAGNYCCKQTSNNISFCILRKYKKQKQK